MMQVSEDTILIMGTGAMACLFAARLSAAGITVQMIGSWPEGLEAIRANGVRIVDASGAEKSYSVQVFDQPSDCSGARNALVLVKSWQTTRAARQLAECLDSNGVALTLQNGIGNREILARNLGGQRVSLGVTTIGATLIAPGRVIQAGEGIISLSSNPHLTTMINLLRSSGFIIETEPDQTALLWGKLVISAAINPLTALLRIPNGELLYRSQARALLQSAVREAASVAIAQGIRLPYPDPVIATETIARRTASNYSSMLQDVQRGSQTEIDAICGAIVQAGERTGVPTPIIRTLWQLVKSLHPD